MEADERILNKLEQLKQVFSELKQNVSDIRMKMNTSLGSVDEEREAFEQLNGRVAGLLEQISIYADTLKDILGYKTQLEDMIVKVHKIDVYKQKHEELESNFQSLSEKINMSIEKEEEDFDHYIDSQREQIQRIRNDFNQNLKSFEEDHQKQIKAMGDDEMDRIKTEIKFCENDAIEQMNQRSAKIQNYLKEGKQTLLKQRDTIIREIELFGEQAKSDLVKKLSEIDTAHQEQLKIKNLIEDEKNGLDKSLKVNKWMMIINMMVMGMTVTVLLLSVLF